MGTIVSDPAGLTFGAAVIDGQNIQFTIAGGTDGTPYKITVPYVTAAHPELHAEVYLDVAEI